MKGFWKDEEEKPNYKRCPKDDEHKIQNSSLLSS